MAWTIKAASSVLLTTAILLIPGSGAATPDYMDEDGDPNTGPTDIIGLSADSDGSMFMLTLHIDAFEDNQPSIEYWWDFVAGNDVYRWQCTVEGSHGALSLDCATQNIPGRYASFGNAGRTIESSSASLGSSIDLKAPGGRTAEATYILDPTENTLQLKAPYAQLGIRSGGSVELLEGGARNSSPLHKNTDLDLMILGAIITLR